MSNSSIILFDNAAEENSDPSVENQGAEIPLDVPNRLGSLEAVLSHLQNMGFMSLGSMHRNYLGIFVRWVGRADHVESAPNGSIPRNMHDGPSACNIFGLAKSDRLFQGDWIGLASHHLGVAIGDGMLYVSWDGATEVDHWEVEVLGDDVSFYIVSQVITTGFETEIGLSSQPLQDSPIRPVEVLQVRR
ncbi:hypothetical protein N7493_007057 [Penicillium malachiteum]|uniref:Uncharacterized protein n=1 Tax=Penicillium malachiteum TaxID=1324776 RepID=A0AAD6HJX5_9EURO|nr:hypothetical protein N7493_007057 [Penicillium malachiteum]